MPIPLRRQAPGQSPHLADDVTWTRLLDPRERYRILYVDRNGERTERTVELLKLGHSQGIAYAGVNHDGRFKTLRLDRILAVLEQFTTGHSPSLSPAVTYSTVLPPFPLAEAVYRIPTIAKTNRTWSVDLNRYTCACPEKRIRAARGYQPGQLGHICPHLARAILANLPETANWPTELLDFLRDPRKVHRDNLT